MPFDLYCHSVVGQIHKRVCGLCDKYFPTQVALKGHKAVHRVHYVVTEEEEEESDAQSILTEDHLQTSDSTDIVIVRNLFEWLQSQLYPLKDLIVESGIIADLSHADQQQ